MADGFDEAVERNPHLGEYLAELRARGEEAPRFTARLGRDDAKEPRPNVIYPVGDPLFIHILGPRREEGAHAITKYIAVEPKLHEEDRAAYQRARKFLFEHAPEVEPPETPKEFQDALDTLLTRAFEEGKVLKVAPDPERVKVAIRYFTRRDILEQGLLEPLMRDPHIEDIHALGLKPVHVVHKVFGMVETSLKFRDATDLDDFLVGMSERTGRLISDARPVVDSTLPDGSRINIINSNDVSRGGPSFTIRKFSATPLSIAQLIQWGTTNEVIGAYLWLCLEHGMSVFVSGETASGKTTQLNAILPFIPPDKKVLTAEDTAEVLPPHENWQQLITRETGPEESRVRMFDLLKAALRSRPDYMVVGEIRGAEGAVAFQAMQAGHPTMATFHASTVGKLIQRFTSPPISVPATFMDNLNVVLIQQAVYAKGKMIRRVLAVEEIEGYSKISGGVTTRQVFTWDPVHDRFIFSGRNNSFVLESLIAERMGLTDRRAIYKEMEKRARFLRSLVQDNVLGYEAVRDRIQATYLKGELHEEAPEARSP
ncbi:MAG TPA: type II/IV secretion system ATPase subunit [Candidatus Thermoplasmatota archaeon]|nr:type II/IV secretion system ATPase subunit [Candidatus Thermoplasmatota archaeon]